MNSAVKNGGALLHPTLLRFSNPKKAQVNREEIPHFALLAWNDTPESENESESESENENENEPESLQ